MPVLDIAVKPFFTLLSIPSLLCGSHTMLLNALGTETIGSLLGDTGLLEAGDPGSPTFDVDPLTYVGSGTAQPGVKVLGITVPLGAAKDIVVFEVNGQYTAHFPDGEPNLLGAIAMVVDINPVSYQVFTPVCFVSGTHLLTQSGKTPVENIRIVDALMTCDHGPQSVRWIGKGEMRFCPDTHKHKPILFQAGSLGDGLPERDLRVSPQHRIVLSGDAGAQAFGQDDVLAPVKGSVGLAHVRQMRGCRCATYYSIQPDRYERPLFRIETAQATAQSQCRTTSSQKNRQRSDQARSRAISMARSIISGLIIG